MTVSPKERFHQRHYAGIRVSRTECPEVWSARFNVEIEAGQLGKNSKRNEGIIERMLSLDGWCGMASR
jgi:hypothetical protein